MDLRVPRWPLALLALWMAASSLLPAGFTEGVLEILGKLRTLSGAFVLEDEVDLDLLSWWQTRTSQQVERLRQVVRDQDDETWRRVPGRWTRDYVHALLTHLETAAPRSGGTGFAGSPVRSGSRPLRDVLTVPATRAAPVITLYLSP